MEQQTAAHLYKEEMEKEIENLKGMIAEFNTKFKDWQKRTRMDPNIGWEYRDNAKGIKLIEVTARVYQAPIDHDRINEVFKQIDKEETPIETE